MIYTIFTNGKIGVQRTWINGKVLQQNWTLISSTQEIYSKLTH
jgi:hypothetical protein